MDKLNELSNFKIYGNGNFIFIFISGYYKDNKKCTFMATTPILKYILCDMSESITLGSLSKCQMGSIYMALKNISCTYDIVTYSVNNVIISNGESSCYKRMFLKKEK